MRKDERAAHGGRRHIWAGQADSSRSACSWASRREANSPSGNVFPSPYPMWEFAALHNEDEMFLLSNANKAPKAPVADAAR